MVSMIIITFDDLEWCVLILLISNGVSCFAYSLSAGKFLFSLQL